ncbi:MAG: hypothetical protein WCR46_11440, partial [Deltaproteobacteria bacterium]
PKISSGAGVAEGSISSATGLDSSSWPPLGILWSMGAVLYHLFFRCDPMYRNCKLKAQRTKAGML